MTGAVHHSPSVVTPKATVVATGASVVLPADASVVTPISDLTLQGIASAPAAASSGVAALSLLVSIKNAIAFRVAAASEIISNSTSSVEA